eukprot:GHVQ01002907.1.p1 GENE.GHVQ01002907.1~~GHVQ01002907.1.p1  ORF type:complete len:357 (+),score=23.06 GHVQ01002907.1:126-1196(+)
MCGRMSCSLCAGRIQEVVGIDKLRRAEEYRVKYNLGPQCRVPIAYRKPTGELEVCFAVWGLQPSFSSPEDRGKYKTINARIETLTTSPLYRRLVHHNRCVVICDGFYEWVATGKQKLPYFIRHTFSSDRLPGKIPIEVFTLTDGESKQRTGKPERDQQQQEQGSPQDKTAKQEKEPLSPKTELLFEGERGHCYVKHEGQESDKPVKTASISGSRALKRQATASAPEPLNSLEKKARKEEERPAVLSEVQMPLIMAGLYDVREDAYSFTVITMESEGTPLEAVHNRMPALLTQKTARRWLSGDEFSTVIQEVAKESKQLGESCPRSVTITFSQNFAKKHAPRRSIFVIPVGSTCGYS